jgi:2-dehydropantoate 2-reductase
MPAQPAPNSPLPRCLRCAIVGSGAIGGAMAARLVHGGHEVTMVVRSAQRAAQLQAMGLTCHERDETIIARPIIVSALPDQPYDLLVLAVKADQLPAAVAALPASLGAQTLVLPLVNGIPWWFRRDAQGQFTPIRAVDPDGTLARRFVPQQIVGSVVYTTAMTQSPCALKVMHKQSLVVGALDQASQPTVEQLAQTLRDCGIVVDVCPHIHDAVWTKVALNLATNPLSVVTGAMLGDLCSDDRLLPTVSSILDEAGCLAARYDARPMLTRSAMLARGRAAGAFRTSMLEDHLHGRPLELSSIADAVFELADSINIDLPVTRSVVNLARFQAQQQPMIGL